MIKSFELSIYINLIIKIVFLSKAYPLSCLIYRVKTLSFFTGSVQRFYMTRINTFSILQPTFS